MKTIGLYYGSTTGTTETVAGKIAAALGIEAKNVSELSDDAIASVDVLILGTSTWGFGDLQDDWYDGVKKLEKANLNGKVVALFGCGDSSSYSDTFCEGMSHIFEAIADKGCKIVGAVATDGYSFDSSNAVRDGKFVGLALDEDNESGKTDTRIENWLSQIKADLN